MLSEKDLRYLALCEIGARMFSTCSKRQYLSIILDDGGRVSGMGYNGSAPGAPHCSDGHCPRFAENSESGSNYDNCIAIHAEQNAIMYSGRRHTLYINGQPCMTCAKLIAGSAVERIVGISDTSFAMSEEINDFLRVTGVQVDLVERDRVSRLVEKILHR